MKTSVMSWKSKWGNISLFLIVCYGLGQVGLVFWGFKTFLPNFWAEQLSAGWLGITTVFLLFSLLNCFVEYFVHRYILHIAVNSWLRDIARRHGRHHGLTHILLDPSAGDAAKKVRSRYPITEESQWESVSFPNHTLISFFGFYTFFLIPVQWLLPRIPFFVGGFLAVTFSYMLYEILHITEHKPDSWWEGKKNNSLLMRLRRFHQGHHLHTDCNMAIEGFFGIPVADMVFKTFFMPPRSLLAGDMIYADEIKKPQPRRFIIYLDRKARARSERLYLELAQKKSGN